MALHSTVSSKRLAGKLLLLGTAEGFRPVSTLLYAMGGRQETSILPVPVIREKSQFRAQHDSLSLSPRS